MTNDSTRPSYTATVQEFIERIEKQTVTNTELTVRQAHLASSQDRLEKANNEAHMELARELVAIKAMLLAAAESRAESLTRTARLEAEVLVNRWVSRLSLLFLLTLAATIIGGVLP